MSLAREMGKLEYHHEQLTERAETLASSILQHINRYVCESGVDDWDLERACEQSIQLIQEVAEHGNAHLRQKTA